ncbi:MAG TPA: nucleotidyltransferase domain-containing protein [Candidatus Nanoarchaeia archaeon]|nr:nucleotidyltransferase domain-containing protein [Candidatus Nanoarchaeia archaeon]
MKNQLKIICFFLEHKGESFSINSIAKKLKFNYRIAFEEVKRLAAEKIISLKKFGNANQCRFNYFLNEKVFLAENHRKKILLKNKNLLILYQRLAEINPPFFIFLVFGSYSRGKPQKHSDVDFCLIADDEKISLRIEQILRTFPSETHLLKFTSKDFLSMLKTTEPNVGKEIMLNNVLLKGMENFYELINYAR